MFGRPYLYPDTMSGFLSGHPCLVFRDNGILTAGRNTRRDRIAHRCPGFLFRQNGVILGGISPLLEGSTPRKRDNANLGKPGIEIPTICRDSCRDWRFRGVGDPVSRHFGVIFGAIALKERI